MFGLLTCLAFCLGMSAPTRALGATQPNILVILADDAGYADFGFQGGGIHGDYAALTPNLDRFATNGVRFTSGYVSGPICCPSRAGLLTGRYQERFGFENNVQTNVFAGLPVSERTMADRLKALGYRTYAVGKWHLGERPEYHPNQRGFDEFYGFLGGARTYRRYTGTDNALRLQTNGAYLTETIGQPYLTDLFGFAAANYVAAHVTNFPANPFFMYLAFNGVHTPLEAHPNDLTNAHVQLIPDPQRRTNAAMMLALDRAVGTVINQLTNLGLATNTLVVFLSDNGGPEDREDLHAPNWSDNGPLREGKTTLYEGGIRVPFVMSWPGTIPTHSTGRSIDDPVISLDLLPTFLAAAGGTSPPNAGLDGINLLPRLTGLTTNPLERCLFWRSRGMVNGLSAVRLGDWKFQFQTNRVSELYHLPTDLGESNNLAAVFPEKLAELMAAHAEWERGVILPLWDDGAPNNSTDALRFDASPLGYVVEKTDPGGGTLRYELREPLSLSNDWALTWRMESEETILKNRSGSVRSVTDAEL